MYRLVFLSGRYQGKRLVIRQPVTVIGQAPDCHLPLADDPQLAQHQARLEIRGRGVYLVNLDSSHPLFCNDTEIRESTPLRHNDILLLGQTRIQYQDIFTPAPRLEPSPGLLQPATFLLVAAVLAVQVWLVAYLMDWPRRLIHPATEVEDIARAEIIRAERNAETNQVAPPPAPATVVAMPGTETAAPADPMRPPSFPTELAGPPPEIVQVLQEAEFPPASPETPLESFPPISAADPKIEEAQRMLAEAVAAAQFADYTQAYRLLNQIHQTAPGFLPAHVEHARLDEARGDLDKAQERWGLILGLAPPSSPFREQAAAARARLFQLRQLQTQILQNVEIRSLANLPRDIRIGSAEIQKLPADADVAEMRLLRISLERSPNARLFKDAVLQLFVTFYDAPFNGTPHVTRALTTPSPILLERAFPDKRQLTLEATYVVPRGLRAKEEMEQGQRTAFYGYTLHLFAGQVLQDALAKPKKLLEQPIHFSSSDR